MGKYIKLHDAYISMRLGAYPCNVAPDTLLHKLYGKNETSERHRHRYKFNNEYRKKLTQSGLVISGTSFNGKLVEAVEVQNHPFFIGVQFHPEFKSRPDNPHPLFFGLIRTALKRRQAYESQQKLSKFAGKLSFC